MLESNGSEHTKARSPQEILIYWINERENIRKLKEREWATKPWSKDPIFQNTYFCNVHREDDKVTRFIRSQWMVDSVHRAKDSDINVEPNMCMARLVNRIVSLDYLSWPWSIFYDGDFKRCAEKLQPFWGSAYVVTTHGLPMSKVEYACNVLGACFNRLPLTGIPPTLSAYHTALMELEGFGSFMAGQVVADLKNTPGHPLREAEDWHTWSCHGPGSLRGLNYIFRGTNVSVTAANYQIGIKRIWKEVKDEVPPMCMQDFQNCLCEYSKYMKVHLGEGRAKRKYDGT